MQNNIADYIVKDTLTRSDFKITEWKERYSEEEYPRKLVMNIFYELISMEAFYPKLLSCFEENVHGDADINKNVDFLWKEYRELQGKINQRIQGLREAEILVKDIASFEDFRELIDGAAKGDEQSLAFLDQNYKWVLLTKNFLFHWAALGLMPNFNADGFQDQNYLGSAKYDKACFLVTGMIKGGTDYKSFSSTWSSFSNLANPYLGNS